MAAMETHRTPPWGEVRPNEDEPLENMVAGTVGHDDTYRRLPPETGI
jgi:hypothetical protein